MNKLLGLTVTASMLVVVAACSGATPTPETAGTDEPIKGASNSTSSAPAGGTPAKGAPSQAPGSSTPAAPPDPALPDPTQAGTDGQPGRVSVNEHCCYGAMYFRCPSTAACFGGFDFDACLAKCAEGDDACSDACSDKEDAAGAPKGCQANVTPPPGVDCANASIDL